MILLFLILALLVIACFCVFLGFFMPLIIIQVTVWASLIRSLLKKDDK